MKKIMLVLVVMLAVVLATSLQAAVKSGELRGTDRAAEMEQKIDKMRAQMKADGHTYEIGWNEAMNYFTRSIMRLEAGISRFRGCQS
jgi:hypothetical protein